MHPWWPHLFSWPRFFDPISWTWLSVKGYAFTSSGEQVSFVVAAFVIYRHHNCHHHRCPWVGRHLHPVHGLLCKKHHVVAGGQIPGKHYDLKAIEPEGEP